MEAKIFECVAHWISNLREAEEGEYFKIQIGAAHCALCFCFNFPELRRSERCIGCPIYKKTGERYCDNTPFPEIQQSLYSVRVNEELAELDAMQLIFDIEDEISFLLQVFDEEVDNEQC